MPTVWLTYAWADNVSQDVDFIAQELNLAGLTVKLDRWNITAGLRLWDQISRFIQDPQECDAWVLYATATSLGSEPCREEYAYALDRALNSRGETFPIIAVFPGAVDREVIPAGIRVRLYVSTKDVDWKERVHAAVEKRELQQSPSTIEPYYIAAIALPGVDGKVPHRIEMRPRAGSWAPFIVGIPIDEKEKVNPTLTHGHAGSPPRWSMMQIVGEGIDLTHRWWTIEAGNEASPTQSFYLHCDSLPSRLLFGPVSGTQYQWAPQAAQTLSDNQTAAPANLPRPRFSPRIPQVPSLEHGARLLQFCLSDPLHRYHSFENQIEMTQLSDGRWHACYRTSVGADGKTLEFHGVHKSISGAAIDLLKAWCCGNSDGNSEFGPERPSTPSM